MLITSSISDLVQIIKHGGVIAYPTEAVWGLGCDPFNKNAVDKILTLKKRPVEKGLILICSQTKHLMAWKEQLEPSLFERLTTPTQQPTSWVVPDTNIAPAWVRGNHNSVAIRLTQHQPIITLCDALEYPLISTSANPSSDAAATSLEEVIRYFDQQVDAIYDAPLGSAKQPSQVRDLISDKLYRA